MKTGERKRNVYVAYYEAGFKGACVYVAADNIQQATHFVETEKFMIGTPIMILSGAIAYTKTAPVELNVTNV